ncbi:DNA-binding protein [Halomonas sp. ISL-60]|nr:DNA-binding protein [Halomonas sp. ISL-60]
MNITNKRIHEVANQLSDKGIKPTLNAVREELGSGSFTTIGEAMKSWRDAQKAENNFVEVNIPDSLDEKVKTLISSVWKEANQLANDKLNEDRKVLQETRERLEEEASESREAVKILEDEAEQSLEEIGGLRNKVEQSDKEKGLLIEKNNKLSQRIAVLEASEKNLAHQLSKSEERESEMRSILQYGNQKIAN